MPGRARFASKTVRLALVCSLAVGDLAGCTNGGTLFDGTVDKSDACGVQHRDFAQSQNYYMNKALAGAVTGALGGAALGAISAALTGGNVGRGAAIGAGAGAAAGAYAGYWNAKQKDISDQAQLSQSIYGDVQKAATELDRVDHTFALVYQCRREQAALIKGQLKRGEITLADAKVRMADQQKRLKDEVALAKKYGAKMNDQEESFKVAASNLAKDDPAAQQALNAPRRSTRPAAPAATGTLTIISAANVRKAPDKNAEKIDGLFPGAQVQAPEPAANGWRKITYNGKEGYVVASVLSDSGAKPAATPAAPPAATTPAPESSDPKVAIAQNVTETIPEKREHYDKTVGDAEKDSELAFNLDQSPNG